MERSWERAMVNGQWASEFFSNKNESVENMLASSLRPSWVAITRMTVLTRAYQAYFSSFFLRQAKKNAKPEWARKCDGMSDESMKLFDTSLFVENLQRKYFYLYRVAAIMKRNLTFGGSWILVTNANIADEALWGSCLMNINAPTPIIKKLLSTVHVEMTYRRFCQWSLTAEKHYAVFYDCQLAP